MDNKKRIKGWEKGQIHFELRLTELKDMTTYDVKNMWSIYGLILINENARKCAILHQGKEYEGKYLKEEYQQ